MIACLEELARLLIIECIAKLNNGIIFMEISIYDFLRSVDENNRANVMALKYATTILEDFKNLSPAGCKIMADTLMD